MRKSLLKLFFTALAVVLGTVEGNTCTNVIVSRGASKDGSVLVSYAADSHYLFGELYYHRTKKSLHQFSKARSYRGNSDVWIQRP